GFSRVIQDGILNLVTRAPCAPSDTSAAPSPPPAAVLESCNAAQKPPQIPPPCSPGKCPPVWPGAGRPWNLPWVQTQSSATCPTARNTPPPARAEHCSK